MHTLVRNIFGRARTASLALIAAASGAAGCSSSSSTPSEGSEGPGVNDGGSAGSMYVLGSVVIDPEGKRMTYVQAVRSLDSGPFNNENAVELVGNGLIMTSGNSVFVGLAEEPTWVRYSVDATGKLTRTGRLSFLNYGVSAIDFANAIIDGETAVSLLTGPKVAVIWNTSTMTILGEVSLSHLTREGYELEAWTTIAHDGLVYIPGRWADWTGGRIAPGVSLTILDPKTRTIKGVAEDDRCTSGGRVVFDEAGYGYVMGDGRNYSAQMFANAAGKEVTKNCLLRIARGETSFEKDYFFEIPSLTGGHDAIGELDTASQGSGVAFTKIFYQEKLPPGVEPVDFEFWEETAHKLWRIELGDLPTAKEVDGAPFSSLGFTPIALDGRYYSGESMDKGATSEVYETDPATNAAKVRFELDGYFYGVFKVDVTGK